MKGANYRFIHWPMYQDAKKLLGLCHSIAKKLPSEYRFGLANQIIRSSSSVALNIAEGSGKQTDRDLNKYLNIARGSLFETIAALDILKELGIAHHQEVEQALAVCMLVSHQISGFKKKLRT